MSGATLMRLYCLASCATTGMRATVPAYGRSITRTTPAAASTSTRSPSLIADSNPGAPTTAGMPSSRARSAVWLKSPPSSVATAGEHREDRVEVAGRGDGDEHIAGLDPSDRVVVAVAGSRARPRTARIADARAHASRPTTGCPTPRSTPDGSPTAPPCEAAAAAPRRQACRRAASAARGLVRRLGTSAARPARPRSDRSPLKQRADLVGRRVEEVVHLVERVRGRRAAVPPRARHDG